LGGKFRRYLVVVRIDPEQFGAALGFLKTKIETFETDGARLAISSSDGETFGVLGIPNVRRRDRRSTDQSLCQGRQYLCDADRGRRGLGRCRQLTQMGVASAVDLAQALGERISSIHHKTRRGLRRDLALSPDSSLSVPSQLRTARWPRLRPLTDSTTEASPSHQCPPGEPIATLPNNQDSSTVDQVYVTIDTIG